MPITQQHRDRFILAFVGIFYLLAIYKLFNGLWLFQVEPFYFLNRFDGTTWLLMQTGIHQWIIDHPYSWLMIDILFYAFPLVWWILQRKQQVAGVILAFSWLIINWLYVQCYTLYPTNSIESYTAWLLMPILFCTPKLKSFYYLLHAGRYFFLFFFASAAIWKFRQAGIFNLDQMSDVLLVQHKEYLVSSPDNWFSHLVYFLVQHPVLGYLLYLLGTLLELVFVIGFFTCKYDRWLIAGFILFLIMDHLLMRIPYYETLPWVLTLYFSKYKEPA